MNMEIILEADKEISGQMVIRITDVTETVITGNGINIHSLEYGKEAVHFFPFNRIIYTSARS